MQITLNQEEIDDAIEQYVRDQITINDDQEINIEMKAGRGENGNSAIIDIRPAKAKKASKPKPVTRAPKAATKPVEKEPEPEAVEEQPEAEDQTETQESETQEEEAPKPASNIFGKKNKPSEEEQVDADDDPEEEASSKPATSIFSKKKAS